MTTTSPKKALSVSVVSESDVLAIQEQSKSSIEVMLDEYDERSVDSLKVVTEIEDEEVNFKVDSSQKLKISSGSSVKTNPSSSVNLGLVQETPEKFESSSHTLSTPNRRTSRSRCLVNRFGIDDIKLGTVVSPKAKGESSKMLVKAPDPQSEETIPEKEIEASKETDQVGSTNQSDAKVDKTTPDLKPNKRSTRRSSNKGESSKLPEKRLNPQPEATPTEVTGIDLQLETDQDQKPDSKSEKRSSRRASKEENKARNGENKELKLLSDEASNSFTPSTPRSRNLVNRFGIDDVKLGSVVSPKSKIPEFKKDSNADEKEPDSTVEISTPSPRKRKKRLRSFEKAKKNEEIANAPVLRFVGEAVEIRDRLVKAKKMFNDEPSEPVPFQDHSDEDVKTPVKPSRSDSWEVKTCEIGQKAIKMKLNRQAKPQQMNQDERPKPTAINQRFSRSAAAEIGISPKSLRKLALGSPSPKAKRTSRMEKENETNPKFSPMTSMGIYDLTKSPLLDRQNSTPDGEETQHSAPTSPPRSKRRRVNKKLDLM